MIGLWLFPPLAGRVGTSPSYAGLASWVREHCLGRRSVPATHSPGCLRLLQLPVHDGGVDLATRVRHQARQGGTNGRFVVAHGGLFGWKDRRGTPFGRLSVPGHVLPRMDNNEETRRARLKPDTTSHPHTRAETLQGRRTIGTATLLMFPP